MTIDQGRARRSHGVVVALRRTALLLVACLVCGAILPARGALAVSPTAASSESAAKASKTYAMIKKSDCLSCHKIYKNVVGPAWATVAERYRGKPDMAPVLANKIIKGSTGVWGKAVMPPHRQLTDAEAKQMAEWVLSLKPEKAVEAKAKTYTYTTVGGKKVTVDFPIFLSSKQKAVTPAVFRGFELFNSYCFRCHGPDAIGGEYAPDLRKMINQGLTRRQFITISMEGRKAKGMPSWAGFFTYNELQKIYEYVKGRATGLVGVGRPPEAND